MKKLKIKLQYDKSKNKKISKSSLSNHKTKNSINETNNNNSNKPPKKFFLNINKYPIGTQFFYLIL